MIKRLKYKEVDFDKYSKCLENSVQRKYSAKKEFLDITSGKNFEILIYNDYQAVMPVPLVRKFGINFVQNPKLCQQLGVFSETDDKEINTLFLNFLNRNYLVSYYAFNDRNQFLTELPTRKNFIMMSEDYETVAQRYSPKRKRKIRQEPEIKENSEIREKLSPFETREFILSTMRGADNNPKDSEDFLQLLNTFYENNSLDLYGYYYHEKLTNLIAVYTDFRTLALLGTFNDPEYMRISGASVLIDYALKNTINQFDFDFEGGDIPNIEEFFRGFRPKMFPYPYLQNSKKNLIKQMLRRGSVFCWR